jgi:hypothetical protein
MGTSVDRYGISFEHRPDYLYVRVNAIANNYEVSREYWREILSVLHQRHYQRMVVEESVPGPLRPLDAHRLFTQLAHSVNSRVKVAIVERFYEKDISRFEETVATNRGMNLAIVDKLEKAEEWLGH